MDSLSVHGYTTAGGSDEARSAVAADLNARYDAHVKPQNLFFTCGAAPALIAAIRALAVDGAEIMAIAPYFAEYRPFVEANGPNFVAVPADREAFQIRFDELEARITSHTQAIIVNSPCNPSGVVYTRETLEAVREILRDRPVFVLCDDVYRSLVYTDDYHSFAEYQDMRDRIIVINSFSKPYAMTGWRLGWCLADAPIRDRMQIFHQYAVVSAPAFVQPACAAALESDTTPIRELYRKRRDYVYGRLMDMGLEVQEPEGAFYVFPSIKRTGMTSDAFCETLLADKRVACVPGTAFGPCGEGHIRCSYATGIDKLNIALEKLADFVANC